MRANESTSEAINRLASRHIAKVLDRLGNTIAPVQQDEIKRQMRFLASDIEQQVINKDTREYDKQEDDRFNR